MKYRRKKKFKFTTSFILLVMIILLTTVGIGYSLWSSDLTVVGTVIAKNENTEPEEPENPDEGLPLEVTVNKATSGEFVDITNAAGAKFVSDTFSDNKLTTTFEVSSPSANWVTGRFTFVNSSIDQYTDAKTTVEVIQGPKDSITNPTISLYGLTSLAPKGECQCYVTFIADPGKMTEKTVLRYTIEFTVNGEQRVFYYDVVYTVA